MFPNLGGNISFHNNTALTGITTKDYFGTKIPIPSTINEQREIASKLSNVDEYLSVLRAIYQTVGWTGVVIYQAPKKIKKQ